MRKPSPVLAAFIALQLAIPTILLAIRIVTGRTVAYGWGWQMFS